MGSGAFVLTGLMLARLHNLFKKLIGRLDYPSGATDIDLADNGVFFDRLLRSPPVPILGRVPVGCWICAGR